MNPLMSSGLKVVSRGIPLTSSYRLFLQDAQDRPVSYWHDLPLFPDDSTPDPYTITMVSEISRGSRAKLEISKTEDFNPILQDQKKCGAPRFYIPRPCFNYGAAPQTWEDPNHHDPNEPGLRGDDDPLDIVEISDTPIPSGSVLSVRVVGAFCLIDQGEIDWKILAISTDSPEIVNVPEWQSAQIIDWFRTYKVQEGKEANVIGYGGRLLDRDEAMAIIHQCHADYQQQWGSVKATH